jgi:hypothetical protein
MAMQKKIYQLIIIIGGLLIFSCTEESNPLFDEQNFTKIYDNDQFNSSYFPIDVRQTPDGGYLILGGRKLTDSNFSGIYLMKVDKYGGFEKDMEVDAAYVNPIADLMEVNGKYYFFCMEELSLQAQLVEVDALVENVLIAPVAGSAFYPSAASSDGNDFVLLSYNHVDKLSVISLINTTGGMLASKGFGIGAGDDVEEPVINHFIRTGRQLPFAAGRVSGGLYYFNGFFNYTFSLVFTDLNQDDPVGVVQGQQDDGGFSAIRPISGSKFAAARFNFGDNYLLPNVNLTTSGVTSSVDLGGNTLPELIPNSKVRILNTVIDGKNTLIYGSDTKSAQIGLLFYDEATGEYFGTKYLGFSNPFEIANLIPTADEGLAVCGTTYVAGRFPRICLFKISKEELAKNIR